VESAAFFKQPQATASKTGCVSGEYAMTSRLVSSKRQSL